MIAGLDSTVKSLYTYIAIALIINVINVERLEYSGYYIYFLIIQGIYKTNSFFAQPESGTSY